MGKEECLYTVGETENGAAIMEVSQKLNIEPPCDTEISLLGIFQRNLD